MGKQELAALSKAFRVNETSSNDGAEAAFVICIPATVRPTNQLSNSPSFEVCSRHLGVGYLVIYYLLQVAYVFGSVCLSGCLAVCQFATLVTKL